MIQDDQKIVFEIKIKTPKGAIYVIYIEGKAANNSGSGIVGTDKKQKN